MSTFGSVDKVDSRLKLSSDQLSLLGELKRWVETEAEFYGRTEEDFLVLFLRSCDFDLELSKKTVRLYYLARIKYPEWWANRDLSHPRIQFLMKQRVAFALTDRNNCPTVMIIRVSRLGPDPTILSPAGIYFSCGLDAMAKRTNCQLNGAIFILDYDKCYWWMWRKAFWLPFVKDVFNSFVLSVPIKLKTVVLVNAPAFTSALLNVARSFLPETYKNKVV